MSDESKSEEKKGILKNANCVDANANVTPKIVSFAWPISSVRIISGLNYI